MGTKNILRAGYVRRLPPILFANRHDGTGTLARHNKKIPLGSIVRALTLFWAGWLASLSAFMLTSCGGSGAAIVINKDELTVPVPKRIRQAAALASNQLEIQISVNGSVMRVLPVMSTDSVVSTVVNIPSGRSNEITIAWFAIVDSQRVLLANFTDVVTAGTTEMNVVRYNSDGPDFDEDGDGRSNLSEAIDNRNLLSQFDIQVPRTDALDASPIRYITDDGIDSEFSGDILQTDEDSLFRLRHNGTSLSVYVCGNDQTLIGDNSAEGGDNRYWHDDTVFIYIDGADSDNQSYDQFDDFQFAFVRSTEELIVSKGPTGVCTGDDCIQYRFYRNSTECSYELDVVLPLNPLNISLNTPVGFDIEIVDDDNGGLREGSSAWIGFDDRSDQNPSTFGTIVLN